MHTSASSTALAVSLTARFRARSRDMMVANIAGPSECWSDETKRWKLIGALFTEEVKACKLKG